MADLKEDGASQIIEQRKLATMFGVCRGTIQRVHSGARYG